MKISKLASGLFAALGSILLVGSIVLSFAALNKPEIQPPAEAKQCAEAVLNALDDGDFAKVGTYLYGEPALDLDREPDTAEAKQLWNAYRDSVSVQTEGSCYGEGTDVYQTAEVTAMDISSVVSQLGSRASALLKQKLEAAGDPAGLLDENGEVPQYLKDEIRAQALTEALADSPKTVTGQITMKLVQQHGQWWAVPDQTLLDILSGGLN